MSDRLNCKEVSRILSDGLDAELPAAVRTRLKLHLAICDACRNVERQFEFIRAALRRGEVDDPPGPPGPPGPPPGR